jgi:hypothetical protein
MTAKTTTALGSKGKNANLIQFRADKALLSHLVHRTNETFTTASQVGERDLLRWYAAASKSIEGLFSETEVLAMLGALATWQIKPDQADEIHRQVAAAIHIDHIDERWQIDGSALVSKLAAMPPVLRLAVLDALEQIRGERAGHVQRVDLSDRIRASGLIKPHGLYVEFARQCMQELAQQEQSIWPDYLEEVRVFSLEVATQDIFPSLAHLVGGGRSAGAALLLKHCTQFLRLETYASLTQSNAKLFAGDDGIFHWLQSTNIQTIRQTEVELKSLLKELHVAGADLLSA